MKVSIIFLGTPQISAEILTKINSIDFIDVKATITAPDRKQGRKMQLTETPVKKTAKHMKIPVYSPSNKKELHDTIKMLEFDVAITAAYGLIIPQKTLDIAKFINIHFSLLPKHRGASPIQAAILNGDNQTGVTLFELNAKMDAGKIIAEQPIKIEESDDIDTLTDKMLTESIVLVKNNLPLYINNRINLIDQNESKSTFCHKISKKDGLIDFKTTKTTNLISMIKAYKHWPSCYTFLKNKMIKILEVKLISSSEKNDISLNNNDNTITPGTLIMKSGRVYIYMKDGAIEILRAQIEGKKECSSKDLYTGYNRFNGVLLG